MAIPNWAVDLVASSTSTMRVNQMAFWAVWEMA